MKNEDPLFKTFLTLQFSQGINLEVSPGMVVGVVGHSGAGKSTLISLIERFYDVPSGAILVDGKDVKGEAL